MEFEKSAHLLPVRDEAKIHFIDHRTAALTVEHAPSGEQDTTTVSGVYMTCSMDGLEPMPAFFTIRKKS